MFLCFSMCVECIGLLQQFVNQGSFIMVNVCDDGDIMQIFDYNFVLGIRNSVLLYMY